MNTAVKRPRKDLGQILGDHILAAPRGGYGPADDLLRTFVREYRFHPTRQWRLDLAWPTLLLGVECEGLTRSGRGYHQSPQHVESECEKHSALAAMGWRVLRVTGRQIQRGYAEKWIVAAIELGLGSPVADVFNRPWDPAAAARLRAKARRKRAADKWSPEEIRAMVSQRSPAIQFNRTRARRTLP